MVSLWFSNYTGSEMPGLGRSASAHALSFCVAFFLSLSLGETPTELFSQSLFSLVCGNQTFQIIMARIRETVPDWHRLYVDCTVPPPKEKHLFETCNWNSRIPRVAGLWSRVWRLSRVSKHLIAESLHCLGPRISRGFKLGFEAFSIPRRTYAASWQYLMSAHRSEFFWSRDSGFSVRPYESCKIFKWRPRPNAFWNW